MKQAPGFRITSKVSKTMVGVADIVVQAIERVLVARDKDPDATAQNIAEVVAWELNLLPIGEHGVLVAKSIKSEMLDERTLAYAVVFEMQTSVGDPLDNGKEEAV